MDKKERLKKQLDFIMEIDKVKNIFRQTYLADGKRKENDAEHSWHLALMAVLLKEYSKEEVDLSKVIPMHMMKKERQPRNTGRSRQQNGSMDYCRKIRDSG